MHNDTPDPERMCIAYIGQPPSGFNGNRSYIPPIDFR
jgi:hypothetical protein